MSATGTRRRAAAPDPLTPAQRRLNMSRIRARDTRPELLLRRALHRAGLRYRLHSRALPGTPDLVMPGRRAVIFVHGCFWHAHDCPYGVTPARNAEFWRAKLARNTARDHEQVALLHALGWRVATVWECALRGRARLDAEAVARAVSSWLNDTAASLELEGDWPKDKKRPEGPRGMTLDVHENRQPATCLLLLR